MTAVRRATPADLPTLRRIQAGALAVAWPSLLERATRAGWTVVLADGGEPLAYGIVLEADATAYLPEFAVAPVHQRAGHGSRLLAAICDRLAARGAETLTLTVREADEGVRAFYREHDFAVTERRPTAFEDGAGLVLERTLGSEC